MNFGITAFIAIFVFPSVELTIDKKVKYSALSTTMYGFSFSCIGLGGSMSHLMLMLNYDEYQNICDIEMNENI
jgi:hypothetical protein